MVACASWSPCARPSAVAQCRAFNAIFPLHYRTSPGLCRTSLAQLKRRQVFPLSNPSRVPPISNVMDNSKTHVDEVVMLCFELHFCCSWPCLAPSWIQMFCKARMITIWF